MMSPHINNKPAILFVDDELQALKYFNKAFEKDFKVFTAENVTRAKSVLSEHHKEIGILISDQRMPGESGVDLLAHAREHFPYIIRILTTAYTDIDKAIEAVNDGEIYRYITKPWDLPLLKQELLIASRFYALQKERNLLIKEKLGFSEKSIIIDRIRALIILANTLSKIHHTNHAIQAFLSDFSADYHVNHNILNLKNIDFWTVPQYETQRMAVITKQLIELLGESNTQAPASINPRNMLADIVKILNQEQALNEDQGQNNEKIKLIASENVLPLQLDEKLFRLLFESLLREATKASQEQGTVTLQIDQENDTHAIFSVYLSSGHIKNNILFDAIGHELERPNIDLLTVYFLAFHYAGECTTYSDGNDGKFFHVRLPNKLVDAEVSALPEDWIEKVLVQFEDW